MDGNLDEGQSHQSFLTNPMAHSYCTCTRVQKSFDSAIIPSMDHIKVSRCVPADRDVFESNYFRFALELTLYTKRYSTQ